jgi:hypothetical protein
MLLALIYWMYYEMYKRKKKNAYNVREVYKFSRKKNGRYGGRVKIITVNEANEMFVSDFLFLRTKKPRLTEVGTEIN